ncbi:hypothetical protein [Rhodalgimonas zhirmunskyi]|uniref:Uncharacterized protein n=1 Tax=Rhodalgimonas zhirmunskyi TaxID=2964767 RepID=A0AAJ1U4S5_9RHOB|nr:hypothetical protein [Rhodoalgimonas zhirmunskyi]MDQ2093170.1 hypothetical protein [Rhodoalgimonas zhirmunskyi]
MWLRQMHVVSAMVTLGMGGLLSSCGDFVDNAMGINGSPNWNVAIKLEGSWVGQPIPDMGFLVNCLQKDSMTEAEIPHISILIDDGKVTGALTFHDGARLDLLGKTWAGAPHTGHNIVKGKTFFQGREVGVFDMEPNGLSGRLEVDIWDFDRPDTGASCAFYNVLVSRI